MIKDTFEATVRQMQADLNKYAQQENANTKAVAARLRIINVLVDYYNHAEQYIRRLNEENFSNSLKTIELNQRCESLEAICLIHGIDDFKAWLQKGYHYLVASAADKNKKQVATTPRRILESMSEQEKKLAFGRPSIYDDKLKELIKEMEMSANVG